MANYIQKVKEYLKVLRDTDYEFYDGNKDEALDYLESALSSFPEYENSIINQKKLGPVIREQYEGQEVRDRISELDTARGDRLGIDVPKPYLEPDVSPNAYTSGLSWHVRMTKPLANSDRNMSMSATTTQ